MKIYKDCFVEGADQKWSIFYNDSKRASSHLNTNAGFSCSWSIKV